MWGDSDELLAEESLVAPASAGTARDHHARLRQRVFLGLGSIAVGMVSTLLISRSIAQSEPRAFRSADQVGFTLLDKQIDLPQGKKIDTEMRVIELNDSMPAHAAKTEEAESPRGREVQPGPWECARYEPDQDNDWCKARGNVSGEEYKFFGENGPCDECWCCKRKIDAEAGGVEGNDEEVEANASTSDSEVKLDVHEETEADAVEDTESVSGPWQCVRYQGTQDNEWCKTRGNVSGDEYKFFGPGGPCDDCWCCKREIEKKKSCAAKGSDCRADKCCETPGHQCYKKTSLWATCRESCTPGPDPTDANADPWSCKELGPRAEGAPPPIDYELQAADWVATNCSARGEDCSKTMCCQEGGMQCYTKDSFWSSCKPECTPGPDPVDADANPWECKALGSRTPGAPPGWGPAAPWVATNCSGDGEDCTHSKCCREQGLQCYAKDPGQWSMCMPSCLRGPLLTDDNPDKWDCTPLGGRTPGLAKSTEDGHVADWVSKFCADDNTNCTKQMCCSSPTSQCYKKDDTWASCMRGCTPGVQEYDLDNESWSCEGLGPRTPRPWSSPALYCISVAQLYSAEGDIMRTQINTDGGAGIFACEQYDVFSTDGGVYLGDGPMGPVWSQHFEWAGTGTSVDGTSANTRLFINLWGAVKYIGRYLNTDWTVKADPDAVLIADRLRDHLRDRTGQATFIVNCGKGGMTPMMFGSLEAISRQALDIYFDNEDACMGLPVDEWGEDRWLGACLGMIGAPGQEDFSLVSDGVCEGVYCGSGAAAFHPFKGASEWQGCYYEAIR